MTSDGNFYSATVTDFTARDPAIFRMMGPGKHLRTVQYNSRWLNGKMVVRRSWTNSGGVRHFNDINGCIPNGKGMWCGVWKMFIE